MFQQIWGPQFEGISRTLKRSKQQTKGLQLCKQESSRPVSTHDTIKTNKEMIIKRYVSFSDQETEFKARKEELDKGRDAIRQLITSLDQRKDEDINRTFKGVAMYFKYILANFPSFPLS